MDPNLIFVLSESRSYHWNELFRCCRMNGLDVDGDPGADVYWYSRPLLFITSHLLLFFCFSNRSKHVSQEYTLLPLRMWPIYHCRKLRKRAGIPKWWVQEKSSPWREQGITNDLNFPFEEINHKVPDTGGSCYSDGGMLFFFFFNELRQINHGMRFLGLVTGVINVLMMMEHIGKGENKESSFVEKNTVKVILISPFSHRQTMLPLWVNSRFFKDDFGVCDFIPLVPRRDEISVLINIIVPSI